MGTVTPVEDPENVQLNLGLINSEDDLDLRKSFDRSRQSSPKASKTDDDADDELEKSINIPDSDDNSREAKSQNTKHRGKSPDSGISVSNTEDSKPKSIYSDSRRGTPNTKSPSVGKTEIPSRSNSRKGTPIVKSPDPSKCDGRSRFSSLRRGTPKKKITKCYIEGEVLGIETKDPEVEDGGNYMLSYVTEDVFKYICAYLNNYQKGNIYIGVEKDGCVVGMPCGPVSADDLKLRIEQTLEAIVPPIDKNVCHLTFVPVFRRDGYLKEDHKILEITIDPVENQGSLFETDGKTYIIQDRCVYGPLKPSEIQEWCKQVYEVELQTALQEQKSDSSLMIESKINRLKREKENELKLLKETKEEELKIALEKQKIQYEKHIQEEKNKLIKEKEEKIRKLINEKKQLLESSLKSQKDELNKEKEEECNKIINEKNMELKQSEERKDDELYKAIEKMESEHKRKIEKEQSRLLKEKEDELKKLSDEKDDEIAKLEIELSEMKAEQEQKNNKKSQSCSVS